MKLTEIADVIDFERARQHRNFMKAAQDESDREHQETLRKQYANDILNQMSQIMTDYTEKATMRVPGFNNYADMMLVVWMWIDQTNWGERMSEHSRQHYLPKINMIAHHVDRILNPLKELQDRLHTLRDKIPAATKERNNANQMYKLVSKDIAKLSSIRQRYV